MAFPNVTFTEEGRVKTAKVLGVIHWICIVPAVFCLITALYIQLVISDQIYFIENYNGHVLPGFLVFTGAFSLFGHILCGKAFWANHKVKKREKWAKFLLPAVIVTIFIFLFELIAGIVCMVHVGELEDSLASGILTAMKGYSNDLTTKEEIDMLQIEYECCGSSSYQDWFKVAWVHPDYLSKQSKRHKRPTNDDVPFSCCTPHVLRPCIYHHIHDNNKHYNYDYRVKTTLYKKGCADKLMDFYEKTLLSNGGAVILGLSFIQLIVSAVGRIFQTALVNSQDSDDEQGESVGYFFGEIGKDKSADFDTTTETVDTEATDDETLDFSLETEEASEEPLAEEPVEEPAYLPMGGIEEPIYENIKPNQDDEEHIYHDEEVEQYLLNKFNQSKHYFETLSPTEPPLPSGSGVYEEPLPYPPDEFDNSTGHNQSSSKSSIRKHSSTYVGYDPAQDAQATRQVTYANIEPGSYPGHPGHFDFTGAAYQSYVNNSSIVASNVSRNHSLSMKMDGTHNARRSKILRSSAPTRRSSKAASSTRSKSEHYHSISDGPKLLKFVTLPKTTSKAIDGSFLQRSVLNKVEGKNGNRVSSKPLTNIRPKSANKNKPYGSVDKHKLNVTEPLIPKNVRSANANDNLRSFSVKEQVQELCKTTQPLYQRIKREDMPAKKNYFEVRGRQTTFPKGSNKTATYQQRARSKSTQNALARSTIQEMRVQPEIFETDYKPNVNAEKLHKPEYGSTNIRTSNMSFPEISPQHHTVYQARDSKTYVANRDNSVSKTGSNTTSHHKQNNCKTNNSWDNTSGLQCYRHMFKEEKDKSERPLSRVFYPGECTDPRRPVDDTGIYIDSLADSQNASANKSSNSVNVELLRTQSLSPIYPVKSFEPMSPRKRDGSDNDSETIVINLVSGSASDTSTLKNEPD